MKRGSYQRVQQKNRPIVEKIRQLKCLHPYWGYRRIWAHLRYVDKLTIGRNRVYRLMSEENLLVKKNRHLKATRQHHSKKPKPKQPNQWWGIDMTKVMIENYGWVYVVIVIDWFTKKVVGHYAGMQSKSCHWLMALDKAANKQFPMGIREGQVFLMSDNGCQPTAVSFMKSCLRMGIKQAFTSYNNPKGNADTERFMRTLKEELVWISEWKSPQSFFRALDNWIKYYNSSYLHSSLGYKTPEMFERDFEPYSQQNILPLLSNGVLIREYFA